MRPRVRAGAGGSPATVCASSPAVGGLEGVAVEICGSTDGAGCVHTHCHPRAKPLLVGSGRGDSGVPDFREHPTSGPAGLVAPLGEWVGGRTGRASPRGGHTLLPFYSPGAKFCRRIIIQSSQKCGENGGERVSGSQQTKNIFVDFVILLTFKNGEFVISFINLSKHLLPKKKKSREGVGKLPWLSKG